MRNSILKKYILSWRECAKFIERFSLAVLNSIMYTRQEASKNKQAFWTTFGQYMQPVLSEDEQKINWINYKTGVSGINFRMDVNATQASIGIVLSHSDRSVQELHFEQLLQLKTMLHETLGEEWQWQASLTDEHGKTNSSIGTTLRDVNINKHEDWPKLISFFKPRIIALDRFWSMAKYGFER